MNTACTQNIEVIKTTVSLKNEIKEKFTFLWFNLLYYVIIKTFISYEREINACLDKTNRNFIC